jgi:hypothetical protein
MMNRNIVWICTLIVLGPLVGWSDTGTYQRRTTSTDNTHATTTNKKYTFEDKTYFSEHEFSVDAFGLYAFADGTGRLDDDWGGGIGVNYFFTKHLGLGLDGYWWDGDSVSNETVSSFSGSIILRWPFESAHIAPYVFGGGGGHFSGVDQASLHGGGGIEYRFTPHLGTFVDGRYVFTEDTNDFAMIRFGARFVF